MRLNKELKYASVARLIRWWNGDEVPAWSRGMAQFLQKTAHALSLAGSEGVEFLRTQVESEDVSKRAIALGKLADPRIADERSAQYLVDAFHEKQSNEPEIDSGFKTIALNGFVGISYYPLKRAEVEPLLEHEDKWLAAAAMVYLSHAFEDEAIKILEAGLASRNPIMRGHACTEAGFRNIYQLKQKVALLLRDDDKYVANAAQIGYEMFDIVYGDKC